ncbi:DMT family transporter [soil metagenome]
MSPRIDDTDGAAPSMIPPPGRRLVGTAEGTTSAPFTPADWGLLLIPALVWGSSFLLIAEGLESYQPGTITWLRIILGFVALAGVPAARRTRIDRHDWPRVALLGVVWMALPMTMFPLAEQWISSSVTGMLNGSMPLFSAAVAAILLTRLPGRSQLAGLGVGFAGVVAISLPSMQGGSRTALGASLVLVAMVSYGIATNLVVPLQQRYGAIAVIWRTQLVAIALTTPFGLAGVPGSDVELLPTLAIVVLGAAGTGLAFIAAGTLMGRVGATRGSVLAYLIPVVALVLGVTFRGEAVEPVAVAGLVLVLAGAWLVSRAGR